MHTQILKPNKTALCRAAALIQKGSLVAFPTETVYGLGANALDKQAVASIFKVKGRQHDNPLIVHIARAENVLSLARHIPKIAKKLMTAFWPGPLTIVLQKTKNVPSIVTAGLDSVAVRMPANPVAQNLIKRAGVPIAAPSANLSGRPSPTTAKHVFDDLHGKIPLILDGGQCRIGIESTVVDLTHKTPVLLRPGAITLEQLQDAIGNVKVHKGVYGINSETALSPGMKHRHYSPRARLVLVKSRKKLEQAFSSCEGKVGVITFGRKEAFPAVTAHLGNSELSAAAKLFKTLRQMDAKNVDVILAETSPRMGLAVLNRLRRAAQ